MTTLYGTLELRPVRVGFVVDPSSLSDVRRAMRASAGLWGGVCNPLIPAGSAVPPVWARKYSSPKSMTHTHLRFFEPDVYAEAQPGLAASIGVRNFDVFISQPGIVSLDQFERPDKEQWGAPFGLGMINVYQHLRDREFRFQVEGGHRIAEFKSVNERDRPFVECAFGAFSDGPLGESVADGFRTLTGAEEVRGSGREWLRLSRESYRSPLRLTLHDLEREFSGWEMDPVIYVVDPQSPLDLIDLWNLRLFRARVIPVNVHWAKSLGSFVRQDIRNNFSYSSRHIKAGDIRTKIVFGNSISVDVARQFESDAGLRQMEKGTWSSQHGHHLIDERAFDVAPYRRANRSRFIAKATHVELVVRDSARAKSIVFGPLAPEFAPRFHENYCSWVNVIRFSNHWPATNLALQLPTDFDPKDTTHLHMGSGLLPSREGFVLPQFHRADSDSIDLQSSRGAIERWMGQSGVTCRVSEAGRITEQVIDSVSKSFGARLLADRDTIQLLDKMAKSKRTTNTGDVEVFADRTASVASWAAVVSARKQHPFFSRLRLDHFVNAGVLKLGLALDCQHCTHSNWYSIDDVASELECERCRRTFAFPEGSLRFTNTPWRYRLIGPFSAPNYAEGAYATTLAIRTLTDTLSSGRGENSFACGMLLKADAFGEREIDIDFCLWYQRQMVSHPEQDILPVFGEAKSFGTKCFQLKDVERMRKVAGIFPGSFFAFATLKDELAPEEVQLIADFATWGREELDDGRPRAPVIVLTGCELFSHWMLAESWKNEPGLKGRLGKEQRPNLDNLWVLADVTQQLYLGMPSRWDSTKPKAVAPKKQANRSKANSPARSAGAQ